MRAPTLAGAALVCATIGTSGCVGEGTRALIPEPAAQEESAPADSEDEILRRIERVRGIADRLVLDGSGEDWAGVPSIDDVDDAPVEDPGLDIVSVSLAPRAEDVMVLIRTAGAPVRTGVHYSISIDCSDNSTTDCDLYVRGDGPHGLYSFDEGTYEYDHLVLVEPGHALVGNSVEIRLPHSEIRRLFAAAGKPQEGPLRSWIRIRSYSWSRDEDGMSIVDFGPAVASFRLVPRIGPLDPPLPEGGEDARAIGVPVDGSWFVGQGGFTRSTHEGKWAYDLNTVDRSLRSCPPEYASLRFSYRAWGKVVKAPEPGKVVVAVGGRPDRILLHDGMKAGEGAEPNKVGILLSDGMTWFAVHLMEGSVTTTIGTEIAAGTPIGRVGLSGNTEGPHLHIEVRRAGEEDMATPLAFRDVIVGLNGLPGDLWARRMDAWPIREGYFVERAGGW